jgi:hypothetical protein
LNIEDLQEEFNAVIQPIESPAKRKNSSFLKRLATQNEHSAMLNNPAENDSSEVDLKITLDSGN